MLQAVAIMRNFSVVLLLVLGPVGAAGCRQGVGQRCEVAADCNDGLFCVRENAADQDGTCQTTGQPDAAADVPAETSDTTADETPDVSPDVSMDAADEADVAPDGD